MGQAHFPVRVRQETANQRAPTLPCRSLRERLASPAADGFVARRISHARWCWPASSLHPQRSPSQLPTHYALYPVAACLSFLRPPSSSIRSPFNRCFLHHCEALTNGLVKLRVCYWPPPRRRRCPPRPVHPS